MPYKPLIKRLDFYGAIRNVSDDPATGKDGDLILNTGDNKIKIYYAGSWQALHTLTGATIVTGNPIGLLLALTYNTA